MKYRIENINHLWRIPSEMVYCNIAMRKILSLLKGTLNSVFDLYIDRGKHFLNFSLLFAIVSSLFCFLIAGFVSIAAYYIFQTADNTSSLGMFDIFSEIAFYGHWTGVATTMLTVSVGLYAVYLKYAIDDHINLPSITDFRNTIETKNWTAFWYAIAVCTLVLIVTSRPLFVVNEYEQNGLLNLLQTEYSDVSESRMAIFSAWANTVIELIKQYLPYVAGMYIILKDYHDKLNRPLLRKYRAAFLAVLILAFCTNSVMSNVMFYANTCIIKLITIPFNNAIAFGLLSFFVSVVTITFFLLAFAAFMLYPVKYIYESLSQEADESSMEASAGFPESDLLLPDR